MQVYSHWNESFSNILCVSKSLKKKVLPPPKLIQLLSQFSRSKTADIERMLHISRPDTGISTSQQSKTSSTTSSESKKYTKRRYTDSRHQTRHIPDSDTLAGKNTATVSPSSSVTMSSSSSAAAAQNQRTRAQPVWKRRELISSAPKDREGYFWIRSSRMSDGSRWTILSQASSEIWSFVSMLSRWERAENYVGEVCADWLMNSYLILHLGTA